MTLEKLIKALKIEVMPLLTSATTAISCASASTDTEEIISQGSAGSYHEGGAVSSGGMGGNGGSEPVCIEKNSFICHNNDVYWQDSCGTLGELKEDCSEKQFCENGSCLHDCSMVTPISTPSVACIQQNCSFFDTFDYDKCKWDVKAGTPYTSNEKLYLEGNALVETKNGPFSLASLCSGDFIVQYKVELLPGSQGAVKISHRNTDPNFSGISVMHHPLEENKTVILDCNGEKVLVGNVDLYSEKTFTVVKTYSRLELQIDNTFAMSIFCDETETPTPVYAMTLVAGSAVLPQAMKIDDVILYCQ